MNKKIILIFLVLCYKYLLAQDSIIVAPSTDENVRKNALYVEFLGNGIFYSINYERYLFQADKIFFKGVLGVGYSPFEPYINYSQHWIFPIGLSCTIGKKRHKFEFKPTVSIIYDQFPYPATKSEREKFLANIDTRGDGPYQPPLSVLYSPSIGYSFSIWQWLLTKINFDPFIYKEYRKSEKSIYVFIPWGGLSAGIKF